MKKHIIYIKSGVISILLMTIWTIVMFVTKMQGTFAVIIQYTLFILGIYSSHYFYKKEYEDMSYIQGTQMGLGTSSIVGGFYSILAYLALKFDTKNNVLSTLKTAIVKSAKQRNVPAEKLTEITSKLNWYLTPFKCALFILIVFIFIGLLFSLIVSIFSRTKNNDA